MRIVEKIEPRSEPSVYWPAALFRRAAPFLNFRPQSDGRIMEDGTDSITAKIQQLSDLELALLICFVAEQHCCVVNTEDGIEGAEQELALVGIEARLELHLAYSS